MVNSLLLDCIIISLLMINHLWKVTETKLKTTAVNNIYDVPPIPLEEHNEAIDSLNKIVQGMKNQSYKMEGLSQANAVLISSKLSFMSQLAQMTSTMNAIKEQLKNYMQHQKIQQE